MLPVKVILADRQQLFVEGLLVILNSVTEIQVVATALSNTEVLQLLTKESCQVLVLDIYVPMQEDIGTIKYIREQYPQIHILVFTGTFCPKLIRNAMLAGASGFILKNIKKDELIKAIETVARGEIYLGESVTQALAEQYAAFTSGLRQ